MKCDICSKEIVEPTDGFNAGYAIDTEKHIICYECCANSDRLHMNLHGRIVLYLVKRKAEGPVENYVHYVTNWPGSLERKTLGVRVGRHNIACKRYDFWFAGFDGHWWHGVQYGDNTQIAHCRRTKEKIKAT